MPRVGFAYQLDDKTVLRGGWGMFFDTNNVLNDGLNQTGYSRNTNTTVTNDNGLTFNGTNLTSPECRASLAACRTIFVDPSPCVVTERASMFPGKRSRAHGTAGSWHHLSRLRLGAREAAPFSTWTAAAVWRIDGRRGCLSWFEADQIQVGKRLDALPEKYWASGLFRNNALANDLNSNFTNPFNINNFAALATSDPLVYADMRTNGFFTNANMAKSNLLRPYPNMNGLTNGRDPGGEQVYNHLEATVTKRFSRGYSFQVSYIWASNIERVTRENEFDDFLVWRPTNNSAPHNLNANFVYEFPFGKGRKWLSENKWANAFVGGWQVAGVYYKQSGRVYDTGNWFFYGDDMRAIAKDAKDQTTDAWFNWQLFPGASRDFSASNRAAYEARIRALIPETLLQRMGNICGSGNNAACTYSNVTPTNFQPNSFHRRVFPTRLNWLRSHGKNQFDINILRRVPLTESQTLEFRLDLINAFNHVLWDVPNTDINNSNFGRVTTQWNTPRCIQFQLRYTF